MLNIHEIFESLQGEGSFFGVPSCFIRLQGCDCHCPWCDTTAAWKMTGGKAMQESDIVRRLSVIRHVVITGGEPLLQDVLPLIWMLRRQNKDVQIETSGTAYRFIPEDVWVTVSPKVRIKKALDHRMLARANEIKFVVTDKTDLELFDELVRPFITTDKILLQPESCKDSSLQLCIKTVKERNWRLSVQMHKYINIP